MPNGITKGASLPTMSKKSRTTQSRKFKGRYYDQFNISGEIVEGLTLEKVFNGLQYTESVGHDWPPPQGTGVVDRGGPFYTTHQYVEVVPRHTRMFGSTNIGPTGQPKKTERYTGPVFIYPSSTAPGTSAFPSNPASSKDEMDEAGATAVSRCKPTNSAIDLGVMAGEILREGLPRFGPSAGWLDRTRTAKSAGSDYLNVQFGWKPLVSEIQTFASEVDKTYAALEQLRRDDKRLVRRGYDFEVESEISDPTVVGPISSVAWFPHRDPAWVVGGSTAGSEVIRTVETVRRKWFRGSFMYHLPDSLKGESELGDLRALIQHSLGLDLTPEVLWNLTPWSWAVDWFSNTGDVISNISDSQKYGLIMPHGYMMEHSIRKYTYAVRNFRGFKPDGAQPSVCSLVTETKQRHKANPFGFGLTDSSLDSGQVAILAALGLSRSG